MRNKFRGLGVDYAATLRKGDIFQRATSNDKHKKYWSRNGKGNRACWKVLDSPKISDFGLEVLAESLLNDYHKLPRQIIFSGKEKVFFLYRHNEAANIQSRYLIFDPIDNVFLVAHR